MAISVFPPPTQAIAEPITVEGPDSEGVAAAGSLFTVAGQEVGANTTRVLATDSSGRQIAVGAVSAGSAIGTSNPVLIGGSDGTSVRRVLLDATGAVIAVGNIAHDGIDSGSPLKIGGKANLAAPTDVADLDRVDAWFDRAGRLVTNPYAPGSLANGAETAVAGSAVQVIAANVARKKLILQNVGLGNARLGITGVTATTGFQLLANGGVAVFDQPHCPTNAIFAIREGATSTTILAQEVT